MNIRKINRVIHRDLSYFFTGMVIIYCISGIALNHLHQWNPNYIINKTEFNSNLPSDTSLITRLLIENEIKMIVEESVLSYYYPKKQTLKAFVKNGSLTINLETGESLLEIVKRRPFFSHLNFLHYNNPRKWWTTFSDIFAVGLIVITITGLFIIKGKNGITQRGIVLIIAGLLLPLAALFLYFK